jgi:hypothetical protein
MELVNSLVLARATFKISIALVCQVLVSSLGVTVLLGVRSRSFGVVVGKDSGVAIVRGDSGGIAILAVGDSLGRGLGVGEIVGETVGEGRALIGGSEWV